MIYIYNNMLDKVNYYETFKYKNKDKIHEKIKCEICGGTFTYFNKYKHNKTQKHIAIDELLKKYL